MRVGCLWCTRVVAKCRPSKRQRNPLTGKFLQPLLLEACNRPVISRQAGIVLCNSKLLELMFLQSGSEKSYRLQVELHLLAGSAALAHSKTAHSPPKRLSMKAFALWRCLYSTSSVEFRCRWVNLSHWQMYWVVGCLSASSNCL